jgi:crotonobetainyl-CoA:carnitine CoA-transferase CaiB-like acyl-CoA transferase
VFDWGKQRVPLDLKKDADRRAAVAMIEKADVLIENFRPGVMERFGLGAEAMSARNPRLVYLSMPGFASSDTPNRALPGWEGILGAACGLYTDLNALRRFLGLDPVYTALPIASVYGAVHGAIATVLALLAREKDGRGDIIEVPLASAGMSAMCCEALHIVSQPRRYDVPPVPKLVRSVLMPAVQRVIGRLGRSWQKRIHDAVYRRIPALMTSYPCADGRLLYLLAVDHRRHAPALLAHLGLLEELEREGLVVRDPYVAGGHLDNLAEGSLLSRRWQKRIELGLARRLLEKSAEAWERELSEAGIPCAVQRRTDEWLALEALREAGIVLDLPNPPMRRFGRCCWLLEDESTCSADVGVARADVMRPPAGTSRPVLQGLRVLDLSSMIAAPACARTLAEYGAEVIKIENPRPLHGPRMICWYGIDVNQGKRSLLLDLKSEDGRRILQLLVERADVLVHNFSRAAAKRLGITKASLAQFNPNLIICRVGAYEGPGTGAWQERKAYDPVLQAASGIMVRYGSPGQPEYHGITSCVDYLTGYIATFSVALALFKQRRDGCTSVQEAVTSLAQGAQMAQAPLAFDFAGRTWDEPSGQDCVGEHALYRLYKGRDGWFFLAARPDRRAVLLAAPALGCPLTLASAPDGELARFLETRLRKGKIGYWQRVLGPVDVAVFPVRTLAEIRRDAAIPRPAGNNVTGDASIQMIRQRHPVGSDAETVAPAYARLKRSPLRYLDPAPKPGSHSLEILQELGIEAETRRRIVSDGVVATSLSEDYLPP